MHSKQQFFIVFVLIFSLFIAGCALGESSPLVRARPT